MTAKQLDALMRRQFGDDYRSKVIVSPTGAFRLADAFAECGLRDPEASSLDSTGCGLWQVAPPSYPTPRKKDG